MENPIYLSAINEKVAPVCYCYRTVHSVQLFYIFSALIITFCMAIFAFFFIFGDRFLHEKYQKEFAASAEEECDRELNTIE
ncbi:hypothetical protein L5515_005306 [Caenorhabditis briggsae]|uniref:Uncharacterized protein n=1 Tax=Caenorhabditis briggsae TaxID=6238 RepID=A0AAE9EN00_CAEBR|nr:hypothetical protein L3Y34_002462 [Caenorhabditis briggsae]UMM25505.1 hypothetical protein L5515_005306 [Caenorhabditis briggsae]